jgi:hypothetical protein
MTDLNISKKSVTRALKTIAVMMVVTLAVVAMVGMANSTEERKPATPTTPTATENAAASTTPSQLSYVTIYRHNDEVRGTTTTMTGTVERKVHGPLGNTDYLKVNVSTDPCDEHPDWIYTVNSLNQGEPRLVPGDRIEVTGAVGKITRVAVTMQEYEYWPMLTVSDVTILTSADERDYSSNPDCPTSSSLDR